MNLLFFGSLEVNGLVINGHVTGITNPSRTIKHRPKGFSIGKINLEGYYLRVSLTRTEIGENGARALESLLRNRTYVGVYVEGLFKGLVYLTSMISHVDYYDLEIRVMTVEEQYSFTKSSKREDIDWLDKGYLPPR